LQIGRSDIRGQIDQAVCRKALKATEATEIDFIVTGITCLLETNDEISNGLGVRCRGKPRGEQG
jgi:hypothetical protein